MRAKKSIALMLVALWAGSSLGCAPTSTQKPASAAPEQQPAEHNAAPEEAKASKSASGSFFQVEFADSEQPPVPEGCELKATPANVLLQCEDVDALISSALGGDTKPIQQSAIGGMVQSWVDRGWTVQEAGTQTLSMDESQVELTRYKRTQGDAESTGLGGVFKSTTITEMRLAICFPLEGASEVAACAGALDFLIDHVAANRVVGVSMNGEEIAFDSSCVLRNGTVRCGHNVVAWNEFPVSGEARPLPAKKLASILSGNGFKVDLKPVSCSLAGGAGECRLLELSRTGYRDQAVVVLEATVRDRIVSLTCDIVELEDPIELPEPCNKLMDVEFGQ